VRARLLLLQPIAQLLASLEKWNVFLGDLDAVASARIAADPGVPPPDREGAEPAQFDAVATGQGGGDLVENRGDYGLNVALIKVRVCLGKPLHELRFDHGRARWQVDSRYGAKPTHQRQGDCRRSRSSPYLGAMRTSPERLFRWCGGVV
jgi:hypothetical protein